MRLASFGEGAALALDQLRADRSRSALTILGIVIGVASVMAMTSIISGIRSGVLAAIESRGARNFSIMRYDPNVVRVVSDDRWAYRNPRFTLAEADRIAALPPLRGAIPTLYAPADYAFGNRRVANQYVLGRGAGWQQVTAWRVTSGRDLLQADVNAAHAVVLLSTELVHQLFGTLDPLGRRVRIDRQSFEVIGTFETPGNPFQSAREQVGIVPHTSAAKYLDVDREWMRIDAAPRSDVPQQVAMDQVTTTLRTLRHLRPRDPNNFALVTAEESARTFERVSSMFFVVMIALSSVALMVGGVGVIAIMMIAVTERTREIGIRKALGATRREILWQFLVEAVTVTFIGACLGMLLGAGGAFLVAALTPVPARVPLLGLVAALVMAVIAGVVFGIWPAWRAALMDPVEALRYE